MSSRPAFPTSFSFVGSFDVRSSFGDRFALKAEKTNTGGEEFVPQLRSSAYGLLFA